MKKLYTILLVVFSLSALANPILTPTLWFSELFFDEEGQWYLEIQFDGINPDEFPVSSVWLFSSTDSVELPFSEFETAGFYTVNENELAESMHINPLGDSLSLRYDIEIYDFIETMWDDLLFGNVDGAEIGAPRINQSIVYMFGWVKDSSPTLGYYGDTTGVMGSLTGCVYDVDNVPVINEGFKFHYPFTTSETGHYLARVPSRGLEYYYIRQNLASSHSVSIDPISFLMEPDSVVERDIYLTDTLWLNMSPATNIAVSCYPNPVAKSDNINVEISLPFKSSNLRFEMYSSNGELLTEQGVNSKQFSVLAPETAGAYLCVIKSNAVIFWKSKLIVNE